MEGPTRPHLPGTPSAISAVNDNFNKVATSLQGTRRRLTVTRTSAGGPLSPACEAAALLLIGGPLGQTGEEAHLGAQSDSNSDP